MESESLPDEIILHILSYFTYTELCHTALVSKSFHRHCNDNDLWRTLTLRLLDGTSSTTTADVTNWKDHFINCLTLPHIHPDYCTAARPQQPAYFDITHDGRMIYRNMANIGYMCVMLSREKYTTASQPLHFIVQVMNIDGPAKPSTHSPNDMDIGFVSDTHRANWLRDGSAVGAISQQRFATKPRCNVRVDVDFQARRVQFRVDDEDEVSVQKLESFAAWRFAIGMRGNGARAMIQPPTNGIGWIVHDDVQLTT